MASTDSFRLIETSLPFKSKCGEVNQKVILPYQTVAEVIRLISEDVPRNTNCSSRGSNIFSNRGEYISCFSSYTGKFSGLSTNNPTNIYHDTDYIKGATPSVNTFGGRFSFRIRWGSYFFRKQ